MHESECRIDEVFVDPEDLDSTEYLSIDGHALMGLCEPIHEYDEVGATDEWLSWHARSCMVDVAHHANFVPEKMQAKFMAILALSLMYTLRDCVGGEE